MMRLNVNSVRWARVILTYEIETKFDPTIGLPAIRLQYLYKYRV